MSLKGIAVVTGASGFLAGHIIKKLLERGYVVRGTVRNKEKGSLLLKLFPQLELYEAELTKDGSFDEAIKGSTYVFHAASPFPLGEVKDVEIELVEPALNGTLNVLRSAKRSDTVKRVIVTSSVAAIAYKHEDVNHVFDETDWNELSTPSFEAYRYSKKIAEKTAHEFGKVYGLDVVAICPSFILGPPLTVNSTDATSILKVKAFFDGRYDQTCFGVVDVRDVAEAEIRAAEAEFEKSDKHERRYLLSSNEAVPNYELSQILLNSFKKRGQFIEYTDQFPNNPDFKPPHLLKYSHAKTEKELKLVFTPVEDTLFDMGKAVIELGLVAKKS